MTTLRPLGPMRTRLPAKTFADYAAIAVCPVLIMLAVGSVIFFLLAVGYAGTHAGALHWTFFWFVMAMVLVSRIAIEKGSEHAGVYGLALAFATAFMLLRYVEFNLWVFCLLGVIWWATNKLTWDCTVIDDDEDASGEGLLQASKLAPRQPEKSTPAPEPRAAPPPAARKDGPATKKVKWWDWEPGRRRSPTRQPHAPGLWVIYFSLGALVVFGLGQGFLPGQDAAARRYAFGLLVVYLAAALGLLLITSFLGLRRYLRQRHLQMPAAMAATWLTTGGLLIAAILAGCILLPRPNATWSLTAMLDRLGDPVPKTQARPGSSNAPAVGAAPKEGTSSKDAGQDASTPGSGQEPSAPGQSGATDQTPAQAQSANGPGSATGGHDAEGASAARPGPLSHASLKFVQRVIYAVLLVVGLVLLIRSRGWLLRVLLEIWRSLRELWLGMFRRKQTAAPAAGQLSHARSPRPFAALVNPFDSGAAERMSVEELVVQSFNGLEAWAEEHRCGRQPEQTPYEFAERVAGEVPGLANEAGEVARLYVQVAYAKAAALPACRTVLEILWAKMTRGMG